MVWCSEVFSAEGTVGETSWLRLRGWPGPRDPVPEGDPPGHRAQMFQHHRQLHVQLGGRSRFHRPHGPALGHGGVLQRHDGARGEGRVSWCGTVLQHGLPPAAGPLRTISSTPVRPLVQRSQQQPAGQTHPGRRSPTGGQTTRCAGRPKFSYQVAPPNSAWFVQAGTKNRAIFRCLKIRALFSSSVMFGCQHEPSRNGNKPWKCF